MLGDLLAQARLITNYEKDATGATTRWPDTTHYKVTVPVGKRWFCYGGIISRSDSDAVAVWHKDASDNVLHEFDSKSAATGPLPWPSGTTYVSSNFPFPMDAGTYIEMIFGGAQGATAYASCIVLEIDI